MNTQETERERRDATEDEVNILPHVVDSIPFIVWIALVAGTSERFTFYAVSAPWKNYIQNDRDSTAVPGVLGLGQRTATNISSAFFFFSFLAPAVRYPFGRDQYTTSAPQLVVTKRGERVIADRTLTLQYIYNIFYWLTNIGSLSLIASTFLEKEVGFWAAYLLPLCSVRVSIHLLLFRQRSYVKITPQGNVLPQAAKVLAYSARERFRLEAAKPAFQAEKYGRSVPWVNQFVSEIKRGLVACKVMACFVPFYLCMNQITNNLVSQAGQMQLGAIPNDTIQALTPIAYVLLGPIIQKLLYPGLQNQGIAFGTPNNISVWAQAPVYFLPAFAETLGFTTLSEYSYSKAPKDMRSLVQALRQVTVGVGSALGIALSAVAVDPKVMYMYTGLAATMIVVAPGFWAAFRRYDRIDDELNGIGLIQPDERDEMEETTSNTRPREAYFQGHSI
ncbi:oligopeptide transporter [Aspergillus affinis]|uniref:oligopeptide transporter n=1 Tax=Aspergillus affinis TaxID=1070780 RepID=UPI0022FEBA04|nr:oligopeptide transporter [Aspergillus affinis]KAI9035749.1 oligopeptide transporter [Aspergillus affinis]